MALKHTDLWWGPPKKFTLEQEERKISWLELFYDLVYVIAISRINHHLSVHPDVAGLLDYMYFFAVVYWGWLNGSLHHDLHGTSGLRTSLMTLWQMLIVAALVVTADNTHERFTHHITIALMVMQLYITYLWWSVGIYDKVHRKMSRPYTVAYLSAFLLMLATLFLEGPYVQLLFYAALLLNYLPPFFASLTRKQIAGEFRLSSSMSERMGLFTIIVFGEAILGVVNGAGSLHELSPEMWLHFGLSILIVFALWWLFFTLVADRTCKKGLLSGSLMQVLYIPTLMGLGMLGITFDRLFESVSTHESLAKMGFGVSLCVFLTGINALIVFLEYPEAYVQLKASVQRILLVATAAILVVALCFNGYPIIVYLSILLAILLLTILALNIRWLSLRIKQEG
ncbi:MAG: low temperature requirement protein A [Lewinellaceae bacterium]|nr:low temperature requirement protein A [Lewinellaceae bacterium]